MHLTRDEERILKGDKGEAEALAMRIIVNLGDLEGADRLIPIKTAHISGVSYQTGGEGLIRYLERMVKAGARVTVPSSLNPAGMDLREWRSMGVPEEFAETQLEIIDLFSKMGINMTCACNPYELFPAVTSVEKGDHIAWGESNAVIFANSMIGARTNREGGPATLACAIIGKTSNWGMHLDEGRRPTVEVRVGGELDHLGYNLLGAFIGKNMPSDIAIFRGLSPAAGREKMKHMGAALAAKGGHPIYHAEGITPESMLYPPEDTADLQRIDITQKDLLDMKDDLYPPDADDADVFVLGCPQFGAFEFDRLAGLVRGRKMVDGKRILVFAGRDIMPHLPGKWIDEIRESGVEIYHDTCMVVTPLKGMNLGKVGTDSAKAAHYIPRMQGIGSSLLPLEVIVERCMD
ncbi:MAG: aconitase X [Thermoplasmatota archaeon]